MACFHLLEAWRARNGNVVLWKETPDSDYLRLPCGNCLGCRMARAKAWALRCELELQLHRAAVFTTLTYDEKHLPPTLEKLHVQLWLKKLRRRAAQPVRFFASGEYGEKNNRPHYHAIVYGLDVHDGPSIEQSWAQGFCRTVAVTPAAIAYTAGYTSKKIGYSRVTEERVDPETGEVYQWQPPFIQMSRRPGIGGHARQWPESWRSYAVHDGYKQPVPRFLHEAWKAQATPEQLDQLMFEKSQLALLRDTSETRLIAAEQIAIKHQSLQAERRKL